MIRSRSRWYWVPVAPDVPTVRYAPALVAFTEALKRILGTPFIILGSGCLGFLLLGSWFRRVAGEATDF